MALLCGHHVLNQKPPLTLKVGRENLPMDINRKAQTKPGIVFALDKAQETIVMV